MNFETASVSIVHVRIVIIALYSDVDKAPRGDTMRDRSIDRSIVGRWYAGVPQGDNDLEEKRRLLETTLMRGVKGERRARRLFIYVLAEVQCVWPSIPAILSWNIAKLRGRLHLRL